MKKLFVLILVLASVLLMSNFASAGSIKSMATIASSGSFTSSSSPIGVMAPPPLFPTNATFETKAEVIGNHTFGALGGSYADYFAQSFKALSDYIVNGGIWLEQWSTPVPTLRLMLCNNNVSGYPDIANPIVYSSQNITGAVIEARPGRFYLNLTEPVRVQQNKTYWLVVDGHMDSVTAGSAQSRYLNGDPYKDGILTFSNDAGNTWQNLAYPDWDFDFIITFSNRPNKAEVFGVDIVNEVGGNAGSNYYAQSFKALDSYIVDAGVWLEKFYGATPNLRIQIWEDNATGYPDKSNVITSSRVIWGSEINSTQGERFFVHSNVSIPVTVGETYWLVIDGYYDHTTSGDAASRGSSKDTYEDGQFMYSNDVGSGWFTYSIKDLSFIVTFSASHSAIMVDGYPDQVWQGIGGNGTYNYYGQSFKALGKYITEASMWIGSYMSNAPTVRLLLCPKKTVLDGANVTAYLAASINITGIQIMSHSGRYYLNPPKPIEVVLGQTYYLLIDGWIGRNTANASVMTRYRYELNMSNGPYTDGREYMSMDAGDTWWWSYTIDVDVDIRFSDVPYKAQCGSTNFISAVGGSAITPYYAQSFLALNDYIADAGVWLNSAAAPTPDFQLLLCGNNATDPLHQHPDMNNVLAKSLVIRGTTIDANPGLYYIKPSTPISVQRLERYWLVIDGLTYNASTGYAQSRAVNYDFYPDGEFLYAFENLNLGWDPGIPYDAYDLHFDVTFTHVNQPPSQPPVLISPLKPFDSDDLYAYMPYGSTDFEQEPLAYYVEWYKNGVPQPAWANTNTLPKSATNVTDDWTAKITPYDGHINGTANMYTVHVQADILTLDHLVTADSQNFHVFTKSNTTITSFAFYNSTPGTFANITFTSTGPSGAKGFCNITIPKSLMTAPWAIRVNGILMDPPITENGTHTIIQLEYDTSSVPIIIQGTYAVPEFTPAMLLITFAVTTIAIAAVSKKINKRKQQTQHKTTPLFS